MLKNFNFIVGGAIVLFLFTIFIVSFFYLPNHVNEMNISNRLLPPNKQFLLGTDNFGRDILSRIMQGSQTAFIVGSFSVFIGLIGGFMIGAVAGYFGGLIDEVLMRFIDALLAFPGILLALMLVTIFKPSLTVTVVAIGIMSIPSFSRIIRSGFIKYKEANFVRAARNFGASHLRIIFSYILPNNISPIIVTASLSFSTAILIEAALSYLGLGVQPPDPSWGSMLRDAQSYAQIAPWFTVAPGIMITLTVLGFNLLGDGLRDMHDIHK